MPNGIEEITNKNETKANAPVEISSRIIEANPQVEMLSAKGLDRETIVDAIPEPKREKVDSNEPPIPEHGSDKPVEKSDIETIGMEDIPGVTEVSMSPINDAEKRIRLSDLKHPETGEALGLSMKQFIRETMNGGMINVLIKKYDLEGIDLEQEAALIAEKKSRLSRRQRDAVVALNNMRKQQRELLANLSKELINKDNPTDEDLRKLLDSIEDASTNTGEVATAVANEIVRKAVESANTPAEEISAPVEEAMEAAKVDYTPGEGGNDEVTTKALHDAVKNHGRTKFRGVFDSLDLVDDPQVGDVVHTVVPDDKGNHSGEELVYTYLGPNHWKLEGSYIQEELPEPIPEEPAKPDEGSIPLTIGE